MSTKTKKGTKLYRVYIGQVNQTYVEVSARDKVSAATKGRNAWKKIHAYADIIGIEEKD